MIITEEEFTEEELDSLQILLDTNAIPLLRGRTPRPG